MRTFRKVKKIFDRMFPERQIYHRSGETVRYISISPMQQFILASGSAALVAWTLYATAYNLITQYQEASTAMENKYLIAKYERWISEYRVKEELLEEKLAHTVNAYNDLLLSKTSDLDPNGDSVSKIQAENKILGARIRELEASHPASPNLSDVAELNGLLVEERSKREIVEKRSNALELELQEANMQVRQLQSKFDPSYLPEPDFFMRQLVRSKNYVKAVWLQMNPQSERTDEEYTITTFRLFMAFLIPMGWFAVFALNRLIFSIWTTTRT